MIGHDLKAILTAIFVMTASVFTPVYAQTTDSVTILLVSDLDRMEEERGRGGLARLATIAKVERQRGDNVLLVHAGDAISPSLMSGIDQGAHMIKLLNALPLDLMVPGNHEFDFGPDVLAERIAEAEFPVVASNIAVDGEPLAGTKSVHIERIGAFTVGFIGLTTPTTTDRASAGDTATFADIIETTERYAQALRDSGADLVIALGHTHSGEDMALMRSGLVDVILSGDDHHIMTFYKGGALLAESGAQGERIVALDIALEKGQGRRGPYFRWEPSFRMIDSAYAVPDREMDSLIEGFQRSLNEDLDEPIGVTLTPFTSAPVIIRRGEAAFGNLIADAMREATGADIAFTNAGGIRANRDYEAGRVITRRDVQSELPFGNRTVVLEITGKTLRDMLEYGYLRAGRGAFPQISNMKVVISFETNPTGEIESIDVMGEPLDMERTYTLATNDFLAGGGDGYDMLEPLNRLVDGTSGELMVNQVITYIQEKGEISPQEEGRLTLK